MKKPSLIRFFSFFVCLGAAISAHAGMTNTLSASLAAPIGSSTNRGFTVRVAQAWSTNGPVGNSYTRAYKQINGTLLDTNNLVVQNAAFAGTNSGGSWNYDTINFERQASVMDITDENGNVLTTMSADYFPGIPGQEALDNNFAVEAVAYLQLPAGETVFGISCDFERTDSVDDDSYNAFVAPNPRDFFATVVSIAERHTANVFGGNQHLETIMSLTAPVPGVYPFRILYWQTGSGANLNFYTIDNSGNRVLVNDPGNGNSIPAFTDSNQSAGNGPYTAQVSPIPASAGNLASAPVTALLIDGQRTVNVGTVAMTLNGSPAGISANKTGARTSVNFSPSPLRTDPNNAIKLTFSDSGSVAHTNTWSFQINASGASAAAVAGQWDFDRGNLRATTGNDLQYVDPTYDGPSGSAAPSDKTQFGTCTSFGIPLINGQEAAVMRVPGTLDPRTGYVMNSGIAPNGGGTRVNQYTLIMDVMVSSSGPGAAALWRVQPPGATDGDLFWQGNQFGQGGGGYNGKGTFTAGAWHRVIAAYDEAANPPVVTKYVDGIKQDDWTANQGLDAARRSMGTLAYLFADGTPSDERREMWVKSIQIRSGKLTDAQMVLLGGPSAAGIPVNIPASSVAGQWDFERGDLSATIGADLAYVNPTFDGPSGTNANLTTFGTCSALSVSLINGIDAKIMQVPGDLSDQLGYAMVHRIPPNGGGTRVNQYTLIMDVMVDTTGPGAAALWRVQPPGATDGDLFWQANQFGQGGGGYNGKGTFTAGAWHRVVAAYDEAATPPVVTKYVDGIKQDDWTANQGLDASRRSMLPTAYLFADGTPSDERRKMWVKSVQIRSGKLTDAQIVLLGKADGNDIPVGTPSSTVAGQWDFEFGDLSATMGKALAYADPAFDGPSGTNANKTTFGTCSALGVSTINGVDAKIVQVPGDLSPSMGYVMDHGIAPNGGGTRVNQYTLIMDIMVNTSGPGAAALWRVQPPGATDGDLFWQGNNFGQGGGGYNGTGAFTAGAWHRVAASYNEAASPPVVTKYVDGIFQDDWTANQGLDAARRSMLPLAYLFADGTPTDERRTMWVDSIQIRSAPMSKAELAALGPANGNGIPPAVNLPVAPTIHLGYVNGQVVLSWPLSIVGYTLQGSSDLSTWGAPGGTAYANSQVISVAPGKKFLRLIK